MLFHGSGRPNGEQNWGRIAQRRRLGERERERDARIEVLSG